MGQEATSLTQKGNGKGMLGIALTRACGEVKSSHSANALMAMQSIIMDFELGNITQV